MAPMSGDCERLGALWRWCWVWTGAPVVSWIMVYYGWRPAFYVFALVGWSSLAVYRLATDHPEDHPRVSPQELQRIQGDGARLEQQPTPWRAILTHPNVWLLMIANFGFGYGIYIFQSWFYLNLVNVRGSRSCRVAY